MFFAAVVAGFIEGGSDEEKAAIKKLAEVPTVSHDKMKLAKLKPNTHIVLHQINQHMCLCCTPACAWLCCIACSGYIRSRQIALVRLVDLSVIVAFSYLRCRRCRVQVRPRSPGNDELAKQGAQFALSL